MPLSGIKIRKSSSIDLLHFSCVVFIWWIESHSSISQDFGNLDLFQTLKVSFL